MRRSAVFRTFAIAFVPALFLVTAAAAAEVRVMISGGLTAAYNALVPEFERKTATGC
jgi:molybdate transport system substrate-binding protein